jgi:hypothetical protein
MEVTNYWLGYEMAIGNWNPKAKEVLHEEVIRNDSTDGSLV